MSGDVDDEGDISRSDQRRMADILESRTGSVDVVSIIEDGPDGNLRSEYDDVMDELMKFVDDRGTTVEQVDAVYSAVTDGGRYLTSHDGIMEATGYDYHHARQAASVLSDLGDLHECYDDDWGLWWVRCDGFIKRKCEERRISLYRYYAMHPTLMDFQRQVIDWYVRRNRRQKQPFELRALKEEYVHKIQADFFPEKPVGDEWSRHIAARYLRTAQDSIVRAYDLTY